MSSSVGSSASSASSGSRGSSAFIGLPFSSAKCSVKLYETSTRDGLMVLKEGSITIKLRDYQAAFVLNALTGRFSKLSLDELFYKAILSSSKLHTEFAFRNATSGKYDVIVLEGNISHALFSKAAEASFYGELSTLPESQEIALRYTVNSGKSVMIPYEELVEPGMGYNSDFALMRFYASPTYDQFERRALAVTEVYQKVKSA